MTVQRKGYSGPITVTVADPPAGLTVRPGTIAAGQTAGVLSLSAAADAKFPAAPIKLVARGQGVKRPDSNGSRSSRWSSPSRRNLPTCSITEYGLVAAPALALPVDARHAPCADRGRSRLRARPSRSRWSRTKGADGALAISPLPLPPGLTIAERDDRRQGGRGKGHGHRRPSRPPWGR